MTVLRHLSPREGERAREQGGRHHEGEEELRREWRTCQRRRRRIRQVRRRCSSNDSVRRLSPREGEGRESKGGDIMRGRKN